MNCLYCGEAVRKPKIYCNNSCQGQYQSKVKLEAWLKGELVITVDASYPGWMKRYILQRQNGKCNICGISDWMGKPITFEIEHKDGNSRNSVPDNVECLCPNCHSQTPTFKGRNKGRGRGALIKAAITQLVE